MELDPLWRPRTDFPRLSGVVVGFDTETRDPGLDERGPGWCFPDAGEIVGYALAWDEPGRGRQKMYLPVSQRGGGNLPRAGVERYIRDVLGDRSNTVIVHNRLYDEGWCRRHGIPIRARVHDTRTAAPLVNEYLRSYQLDALGGRYLDRHKNEAPLTAFVEKFNAGVRAKAAILHGEKGTAATTLRRHYIREHSLHEKKDLWKFPAYVVAPYAADDADLTLDLWQVLEPLVRQEEQWDVYELESALLPMLLEMRWRGVRVDLPYAERMAREFKAKQHEAQKKLNQIAGMEVAVWEADSLARAFDRAGITYGLTKKTRKPSFRKDFLDSVRHPLADVIREVRMYDKTRSTFLEGYVLDKHERGRVHGQFHPLKTDDGGAVTGRFSSSTPNLENLPSPEKNFEMGVAVRGCFLPEEGQLWAACDYSQQEPRLMVHFAAAARVKGAAAAVQAYVDNPRMDFHSFMAKLTGLERKYAKNIFLGRAYGMGGAKYCHQVGLPTKWITKRDRETGEEYQQEVAGDEGQAQLDQFDDFAPFVKLLSKECERRAKQHGYIKLLLGRRLRYNAEGRKVEMKDYAYKMMNRLVQGSAAYQLKKAMLDMWKAGEVPLVPSHDEIGSSVESKEHAAHIEEIMIDATPLRVPSVVDVELGPSWGATVKVEE